MPSHNTSRLTPPGSLSLRLSDALSYPNPCFLTKCEFIQCSFCAGTPGSKIDTADGGGGYLSLLEQREEENRAEVVRLTQEIANLKLKLLQLNGQIPGAFENGNVSRCWAHVKKQIEKSELGGSQGAELNNEYELIPFSHFTQHRLYPTELGLGKRVVEKPMGYKRKDLNEALETALDNLNRNLTKVKYALDDFVEGIYRTEPTTGTEYELYFKNIFAKSGFTKVTVMRAFAPLVTVSTTPTPSKKEMVHVVLALSGRVANFQSFMDKFVKIGLKNDRRVVLTVVYFGEEGLAEARLIMSKAAGRNSVHLRLLALNETFSRSKGLRAGSERKWEEPQVLGPDPLLFFCDVDVVFSARFLDRCRWNARPGKSVYYPVVFSLYNPRMVYTLQGRKLPSETDQLVISRDTGFWRDFGYGMSCQFKSDLERVRGFGDESAPGWGGEDVALYRKYLHSGLKVVRATDPGIFHVWHPKVRSGRLTPEQYRACIRSRALNEASHAQLGLLAFGSQQETANVTRTAQQPNRNKQQQQRGQAANSQDKL
ncbi:hypothetical protein AAG570_003576 [Ranatra chinensis]|uniref:Hexosyltransferase n=1 Tax=Ranatra chinensis TaxID=642074 RepID=A0ABD0Y420_9HEMI